MDRNLNYQKTHWIYQPKRGSKVVAISGCPSISVIQYPNGCRHVMGGVRLSYQTAKPNNHWRESARNLVMQIVMSIGGIAWDDSGLVSMVVPFDKAFYAANMVEALGGNRIESTDRIPLIRSVIGPEEMENLGNNARALFDLGMLSLEPSGNNCLAFSVSSHPQPLPLVIERLEGSGKDTVVFYQMGEIMIAIAQQVIPSDWSHVVESGYQVEDDSERENVSNEQ